MRLINVAIPQRGRAATKQVYDKNNFPTDRKSQRMKSKGIRQNNLKTK